MQSWKAEQSNLSQSKRTQFFCRSDPALGRGWWNISPPPPCPGQYSTSLPHSLLSIPRCKQGWQATMLKMSRNRWMRLVSLFRKKSAEWRRVGKHSIHHRLIPRRNVSGHIEPIECVWSQPIFLSFTWICTTLTHSWRHAVCHRAPTTGRGIRVLQLRLPSYHAGTFVFVPRSGIQVSKKQNI